MDSIWPVLDIEKISGCFDKPEEKLTIGIDGYIDEVWQIVKSRKSLRECVLYDKMKAFGEAIVECGEGGFSHEIVRKRRTYGGFTANTGKAVARLGFKPYLIGMFGQSRIDRVFEEFDGPCSLVSVGEACESHIFEFEDGKVMLPHIEEIMVFNWDSLLKAIDIDALSKIFLGSDIIALGYWSLMPAFDEMISKIYENFIGVGSCRRVFFDFADIRKRDRKSLDHTLALLAKLNRKRPMTLSLNENEAEILFEYFDEEFDRDKAVESAIVSVRQKIELDELVIHTPHFASASNVEEGVVTVPQRYCEKPVITTGAGDTFNGGYLAASLCRLDIAERLAVGNAATGFYVSNGYAPDKCHLIGELKEMKACLQ